MFLPAARERVELVEVISLADADNERVVAIWEAADTRDALALIGSLPGGDKKRCFVPGWRIRAHSDTEFLFEIAFCFRCDGARMAGPSVPADQQTIHGLDSESAASQELLTRFRAADQG